jgi:hypothetical protein
MKSFKAWIHQLPKTNHPPTHEGFKPVTAPVRVSFLSCLGTVSYQIRILMYPECILSVS